MANGLIGTVILWLIVAIIAIVVVVYLLNWLYHRSTKEVSFVRTGFGGETVVINGGTLVLPIIHEVTPVNMNVVRIPVALARENAVMTNDRMRVDIEAEFFVRVAQKKEAVAAAASTLGSRTTNAEALGDLLAGKFVGALRSVAAETGLDAMHEKRGQFVAAVEERAADALARNGLELEFVAIIDLDQTNLEFFNPANRFDAEGMTKLIETIEARRKSRNDIEQSAMVAIRTRNLEAEKETLKLEQESESARLSQEREIEALRAAQRTEVLRTQVTQEAEATHARIQTEQQTREREIARQLAVEGAEIKAQETLEQTRIAQEEALEKARIEREKVIRSQQIQQRRDIEASEIETNETIEKSRIETEQSIESSRIAREQALERARIAANDEVENSRIASDRQLRQARIEADEEQAARLIRRNEQVEQTRVAAEQSLDKVRIERERLQQSLEIARRQSTEEAEISSTEEIERARIASERGLDEARILQERDLKQLQVQRDQAVELAEIQRQIAVLQKQAEEAAARVGLAGEQANAVSAEERVATLRETEVAERVAAIDRLMAQKDADTSRIAAEAEKISAAVAAEAQKLRNEAENVLTEEARSSMLRAKLIDHLEGIIRESAKPMEKIEGIRILHVDGVSGHGGGNGRTPTDEVMDSALRYRVQAPLIDEMMKEIGVTGSNITGMGDIFRTAKDAQSVARGAARKDSEDGQS